MARLENLIYEIKTLTESKTKKIKSQDGFISYGFDKNGFNITLKHTIAKQDIELDDRTISGENIGDDFLKDLKSDGFEDSSIFIKLLEWTDDIIKRQFSDDFQRLKFTRKNLKFTVVDNDEESGLIITLKNIPKDWIDEKEIEKAFKSLLKILVKFNDDFIDFLVDRQ